MEVTENTVDLMSTASLLLLMLLNTNRALCVCMDGNYEDDRTWSDIGILQETVEAPSLDVHTVSRAALHHFRLWNTFAVFDKDLGFWVKPRSTAWFSRFLLKEYDDSRWVQMFRMTKSSVFSLAHLLTPTIQRRDTKYRLAIPVLVRLACNLFKLSHGASLLICSEMFAVGCSTVSMMLRQVVHAVNDVLKAEISWPRGDTVATISAAFQHLCALPGVVGAIDGTHIAIKKPKFGASDYYYFKSGGYTMNCQAVVDSSKRFLDLYVGMPGSTNDSRMLRRSTLYHRGVRKTLWDGRHSFYGFALFPLGDAGYPLLWWLLVPHRQQQHLSVADGLFNCKLSRGWAVVENAFALLKQSFKELQHKSELKVTFVPDVVTCCALLHNVLLKQSHEDVERLLEVLRNEGQLNSSHHDCGSSEEAFHPVPDDVGEREGELKRRELGVFLSLQRIVPV